MSAQHDSASLDPSSAGDYILETKPKEISEAQRLNYEQVSLLHQECFCLSACLTEPQTAECGAQGFRDELMFPSPAIIYGICESLTQALCLTDTLREFHHLFFFIFIDVFLCRKSDLWYKHFQCICVLQTDAGLHICIMAA